MSIPILLRAIFEIIVLWVIFYQLYRAFKDSRSAAILAGLVGVVFMGAIVLELLQAAVLQQLASTILGSGMILAVLFQPELRTAFAKLGSKGFIRQVWQHRADKDFVEVVRDSVQYLVSKRYGALIAISRSNSLSEYAKTGTLLDAAYSRELIGTIFMPKTLLHDGAVIVHQERIVAAGAILPVSNRELKDSSLGLRHRAGLGLAESSDAVVIIVSEETGSVSLAVGNMVQRDLSMELLSQRLTQLLYAHHHSEQAA